MRVCRRITWFVQCSTGLGARGIGVLLLPHRSAVDSIRCSDARWPSLDR